MHNGMSAKCLTYKGLVVEQFPYPKRKTKGRPWHISHLGTGLRVCENIPTMEDARLVAVTLGDNWDWVSWKHNMPPGMEIEVPVFLADYYHRRRWPV